MIHQKLFPKVISLVLIVGFLAACAVPAAMPAPVPPTLTAVQPTAPPIPADKSVLETGEITSQALAGNLLGDPETKRFIIYLPPGYASSDKRYPVVYVLHGYGQDEYGLAAPMRLAADSLLAGANAHEMILVFPNAKNVLGGSWYMSSPTIGDYETYITQDLVAYIDAHYRTIPHRDARGVTGLSMGADGAMHLALTHPDVFSVVAPMSGLYEGRSWEYLRGQFRGVPSNISEFSSQPFLIQWIIAGAAAAAPNPDKPPFYLDMPFEIVDGEAQIVSEVAERIDAAGGRRDVEAYLQQPVRLNAMMIYHGSSDQMHPVKSARDWSETLTAEGIEHEYLEVEGGANLDCVPLLQFMSEHLAIEKPE